MHVLPGQGQLGQWRYVSTYENQRKLFLLGWRSSDLLPTDRPPWTTEDGSRATPKSSFDLPSSDWAWQGQWLIQTPSESQEVKQLKKNRKKAKKETDADEGWTYALDYSFGFHSHEQSMDTVRRRKWVRKMVYIGTPHPRSLTLFSEMVPPASLHLNEEDRLKMLERQHGGLCVRVQPGLERKDAQRIGKPHYPY